MSTLKADTIQNTSGGAATLTKQSAAKAWASFGTDAVLDDSLNSSSVTDNSTANFTLTLTNATSSINTVVGGSIIGTTASSFACMLTGSGVAKTTTATRFRTVNYYDSISYYELGPMQLSIHGDLA
jgi:hypothetical protein